jgi:hypothetical protein
MFFSLLALCPIKIQGQKKKNPIFINFSSGKKPCTFLAMACLLDLPTQGRNMVFRFIIEYSSFKGFLALTR